MSKLIQGNKNSFKQQLKINKKGISFDDFDVKPSVEIDPNTTMYNLFKSVADKNSNKICFRDIKHNKEYTYNDLLEIVDNFAAALDLSGVKENDIVSLPIKNSLATAICLLGINKIGAISKWMDCDKSAIELLEDLNKNKTKFIFVSDSVKEKIYSVKNKIKVDNGNIIFIDETKDVLETEFGDFVNKGQYHEVLPVEYNKEKVALMITSSGSTGVPKIIKHSNYAVNSAVKKLTYTDYPINGNIITVVIPPYIGLGLVTSLYSSLIIGGEAEIISEYANPFTFVQYLTENINRFKHLKRDQKVLLFGAPMYFKAMAISIDQIEDLSFIGTMLAAGSKMSKELLDDIDKKFASKGCNVEVCNAYGQNEQMGGITYNTNMHNKKGSAGKIAYATRIMIVDPITKEELPANKVGKILEQSSSQFIGYFDNEEAEKKCIFEDKDGEIWFDTHDLGSIDDEKYVHIFDRESRSIIRFDNKVALAKVEEKLAHSSKIKEAIAVKVNVMGPIGLDQAPFAFVVKNDESEKISFDEIIQEIQMGNYPFNMLEIPVYIQTIAENQIPYKNNKINYLKLSEIAQQLLGNEKLEKEKTKVNKLQ